jgi:hypothetical protein
VRKTMASPIQSRSLRNVTYPEKNMRHFFVLFSLLLISAVFEAQSRMDSLELAYKKAKGSGDHKTAFQNYHEYILLRDSLNNEADRKTALKKQLKYEYDKKAVTDSLLHAKETSVKTVVLEKQKTELKMKRNLQYASFGGILLVIIFSAYMYNRYKVSHKQKLIIEDKERETQKQNIIISEQKSIVEQKQNEILSSIYYAHRIQKALMINEGYIDKKLKELKKN